MKKLSRIYKKFALGGQGSFVNDRLSKLNVSSEGANQAGQATANTVGSIIPIAGLFKGIGEGASKAIRQDDQYGVAKSDNAAGAAAIFNPLQQTTDGISALGKGDFKTAGLNFISPTAAAFLKNQDARRTRDDAIRQFNDEESMKLATLNGEQFKSNDRYSLTERGEGGKITAKDSVSNNISRPIILKDGKVFKPSIGVRKMENGGQLSKLSSNTVLAEGAKHEQGGIKLPSMGAEVEGGETIKKLEGGDAYVMSDTLINPSTNKTFAEDDEQLSKMKGRIEKSGNRFKVNALTLIGKREQNLLNKQEEVKNLMGLNDNSQSGMPQFANGGRLAGEIDPEDQKYFDNEYALKYQGVQDPSVSGTTLQNVDESKFIAPEGTSGNGTSRFSKLSSLTPFIDNVSGALFNRARSKETLPSLNKLSYLNPSFVNYNQSLKDTRDTNRNFSKGIDQTNASSGNANIMKAYGLGEQMRNISRISQEENNVNVGISNDFASRNKSIEEKNNATDFNNQERRRLGRDEIRREDQQNIENISEKIQSQRRDNKFEKLYNDQEDIDLANATPETLQYLRERKALKHKKMGGKLSKLYC